MKSNINILFYAMPIKYRIIIVF